MKKRPRLMTIVGVILVILVAVFVIYGVPFIRSTFTQPITGLPTANGSTGNSLQARYTQTALAKQSNTTATPPASP